MPAPTFPQRNPNARHPSLTLSLTLSRRAYGREDLGGHARLGGLGTPQHALRAATTVRAARRTWHARRTIHALRTWHALRLRTLHDLHALRAVTVLVVMPTG